jgi:3-hydroxyisobutyrate dehydrogenase
MMISGALGDVVQVTPWLERIGRQVYVLGDRPGQAQIMKLVNNLMMAANLVVASEGLVMGAKAGLDPDVMINVLTSSTGRSASSDMLARSALTGAFDFGANLSIVDKDVKLGLAEAHSLSTPVSVIEEAGAFWRAAVEEGLSNEDFTAIIKVVERRGGVTVRSQRTG